MSADPQPAASALEAELDQATRHEASLRVKAIHEFLERGERNTYLHGLRAERDALLRRHAEAREDLETLNRRIEMSIGRAEALRAELEGLKGSLSWRIARRFGLFAGPNGTSAPKMASSTEGAVFTYYLHSSPFRVYRDATFTMRGWAWPEGGGRVNAIRANVDGRLFPGRIGLDEAEVITRYGPQLANPKPGFEVVFDTPPGRHFLALEVQVEDAGWRTLMSTSIWCEPPAK